MSEVSWRFANYPVYESRNLIDELSRRGFNIPADLRLANSWTLNRGRYASVGKLVMTRKDLLAIRDRQKNKHALQVKDGSKSARNQITSYRNLAVVRTQAVWPNVEDHEASDTTPYVVTIADSRYKAHLAQANKRYLRLIGEQTPIGSPIKAKAIVRELFEPLEALFGHPLRFSVTDESVYDLAFDGVDAWDAIWHVLNLVGWSFRVNADGHPEVFQMTNGPDLLPHGGVIDGDYWLERPVVPQKLVMTCQNRDYQWRSKDGATTAGDAHRLDPVYQFTVNAEGLLSAPQGTLERPDRAVAAHYEGERIVWVPIALQTNDFGTKVNESAVRKVMRAYAKRWINAEVMKSRATAYRFEGVYRTEVNHRWGSVSIRNLDVTMTTTVSSVEQDMLTRPGVPCSSFRPGPPNARDWAPYGREAWITVLGPKNPVSSANGDPAETVGPDEVARVAFRSGQLVSDRVNWASPQAGEAVNTTGLKLKAGQVGWAWWNYQLGNQGAWCIVSVGGAETTPNNTPGTLADWSAECISGSEVNAVNDPTSVVVNRGSMLRLLQLSQGRMGVEFRQGPPNTILNTIGSTVYWSDSPRSKNVILVGGRILFGIPPTSSISTGGAHVIMPPAPSRSHAFLIADRKGNNSVKLGWQAPGFNASIKVPKCLTEQEKREEFCKLANSMLLAHLCDYMSSCEENGSPWPDGVNPCPDVGDDGDPDGTGSDGDDEDNTPGPGGTSDPDGDPLDPDGGSNGDGDSGGDGDGCETWVFQNGILIKAPTGSIPSNRGFQNQPIGPAINFNPCIAGSIEGVPLGDGGGSPGEDPEPDEPDPLDDPTDDPGVPDIPDPPDIPDVPDDIFPLDDPFPEPNDIDTPPNEVNPLLDPFPPADPGGDIPDALNDPYPFSGSGDDPIPDNLDDPVIRPPENDANPLFDPFPPSGNDGVDDLDDFFT